MGQLVQEQGPADCMTGCVFEVRVCPRLVSGVRSVFGRVWLSCDRFLFSRASGAQQTMLACLVLFYAGRYLFRFD